MKVQDMWTNTLDTEEQILQAAERILRKRLERKGSVANPSAANEFLRVKYGTVKNEVFGVLFLDTRHRIIELEEIFHGTIDGAEVHPRVVIQRCMHHNAAAIIVFHNHPSGDATPSTADRAVTAQLKQALSYVDVRLLDHIVVSAENCVSMASRGWI